MGGPAWWMSWVLEDMCGIIMCLFFRQTWCKTGAIISKEEFTFDGGFFGNDVVRGGKS